MSIQLTLDTPMLDWLTFTGLAHMDIIKAFNDWLDSRGDYRSTNSKKWQQFRGDEYHFDSGSAFGGMAEIERQDWHAVYVAGELSQSILFYMSPLLERGVVKCKRVDIQTTVIQPGDWGQINFLNRMHAKGKKTEMAQDFDRASGKNLMTVAVGSRTSESYMRVYQKLTDSGDYLLRLEGEYKGGKAEAIIRDMSSHAPSTMLLHHMQKMKDEKIERVFSNSFHGVSPHWAKPTVTTRNKKKQWLLSSCLPAFEDFLNSHDSDGEVQAAFLAVLENHGIV